MTHKAQGFTLIEVMITVLIIGILAAIAYPSYRQQVIRSTRTEAKVALEQRVQQLEKCFTRNMVYTGCNVSTGLTPDGHYTIAVAVPRAGTPAPSYLLTATPAGSQATDAQCLNFTVNETGARNVSGSLSGTPEVCW